MLNRLFIVIGVLAILAIAAAFVVPRFVPWTDYRGRLEAIAGEVLGAEVQIAGQIELSLLPQPRMRFTDMVVGPGEAPTLSVREVEADFSLIDFFRDRYLVTRLVLESPQVMLRVDETGRIDTGIRLPERLTTDISVARAEVTGGSISLNDLRTGDFYGSSEISGEIRLDALRGPFGFSGQGRYGDDVYSARVSTTALDDSGATQLSVFLQPQGEAFSVSAEGRLATGVRPAFSGDLTLRRKPPRGAEVVDAGKGDLVVAGKIELGPDKALFPALTITPDEHRAGTRLTGLAEISLGASRRFNAIIEGAALSLPPRDVTREQAVAPYELVRLLSELPTAPVPGLPGTLRVDIGEVDLRAVVLRRVRFDANSDGRLWTVSDFSAGLPGNASLALDGRLTVDTQGRPAFDGEIELATQRLDLFSAQWRRQESSGPLFNLPGGLSGRVVLAGGELMLSEGLLDIGESRHAVDLAIGFADQRSLAIELDAGTMDADGSAALLALLPDAGRDAAFGITFPRGRFALAADRANLFGLDGRGLDVAGTWEGGVLEVNRLIAEDFGGVRIDATGTAFGTLVRPEVSGRGRLAMVSPDAPALQRAFQNIGAPEALRAFLGRSLPADLTVELSPPGGDGGQSLNLKGTAGVAQLELEAQLAAGIARIFESPIETRLSMQAEDVSALTAQLGLGSVPLLPEDKVMTVAASARGTPRAELETSLLIEGGEDMLGFSGTLRLGDPARPRGSGRVEARLTDPAALVAVAGAGELSLPGFAGTAQLGFDGSRIFSLTEIALRSGDQDVTGTLSVSGEGRAVTGELSVERLEAASLFAALAGPAALLDIEPGPWPDGPLSAGEEPRQSSGRVRLAVAAITAGDRAVVRGADLDFDWDQTSLRLRGLEGRIGEGTLSLDVTLCCAGPLAEKRLNGRGVLSGVSVEDVAPALAAAGINAKLEAGFRFDGSGATLTDVLARMTGDGNFTLSDLRIDRVDPGVFAAIARLPDLIESEPDELDETIENRLAEGTLAAERVEGGFSIAGGVLRSPNLAIPTSGARLFGNASLRLPTLGIEGGYTLTPVGVVDPAGLVTEASSGIAFSLSGTLLEPQATPDAGPMVDAIMVRALEIEVDRLERRRQEDEARRAAAAAEAAERQRIAEEAAARLAAVEAERQRAAEEARRAAEAAEAQRVAEEQRQAEEAARRRAAEAEARRQAEARRKAEEEELLRRALTRRPVDIGFGN